MRPDRSDTQDLSILYKHTGVIHVSAPLTGLERRIYNVLLRHAQPHLRSHDQHSINLSHLAQRLEYRSRNRAHLVRSIEALHTKPVKFNILGKDKKNQDQWVAMQGYLLAEIGIGRDDPDICYYSFGPNMARLLADPAIYTRLSLESQNRLSNKHAIALHEFYLAALPAHLHSIRLDVAVDTYCELLCLSSASYGQYKHLRARVLEPAHRDISENGDIEVEQVDQTRRRNAVVSITVRIARKARDRVPLGSISQEVLGPDASAEDLVAALTDRGVHERVAQDLVDKHPTKQVIGNLRYSDEQAAQGGTDGPGFYVSAIRKDYARTQVGATPPLVTQDRQSGVEEMDETRIFAARYLDSLTPAQRKQLIEGFLASPYGESLMEGQGGRALDTNSDAFRQVLLLHLEHEQPWARR
ncbi:hypothetical protein TK90_2773 (plasmid) [Thioalkalivibrio sp. K90mix]|uniref:replication initiation protein n=1 Tax=Thioalkalivibrio sp. (strain K90mix) TaxID=396595 RepID=UPI000195A688|nr:replication initiation protein [Thioalkalivibrio sp. K90mix]ADC73258.1 hypothetical protein TK90_2773 [Thioalkalivibrio sp. K90mix]